MFWMQGLGNAVWWLRWKNNVADTGTWGIYNLSGNINLRIRKGGTNTNITFPTPVDGAWHHYAGTYDGTNSRLYVDGVLRATSGSVTAPLDTADLIDCMETSLSTQVMDDLRILDEVYSQAQIVTAMNTPVASSSGSTGTLAASLPSLTAAAAGTATATGALAAALPTPSAALAGAGVGSGLLAASLPSAVAALAASAATAAVLAGTAPSLTAQFTGEASGAGAMLADLPLPTVGLLGVTRNHAVLAGELPAPAGAFTGSADTEEKLLLVVLSPPVVALAAEVVNEGGFTGTLPALTAAMSGGSYISALFLDGLPELQAEFIGSVFEPGQGQLLVTLPMLRAVTGRAGKMRELDQQRRATRAFIMASPVDIVLTPRLETKTGSGAVDVTEGVPRPVQTFRLIPMSHTERPASSNESGGDVQRKYDMTLLGEWDAVVQENDSWTDVNGQRYIVDAVIPFNGYEVKGLVMSYGRRGSIV
jgi:hypothetical protein